MKDLDDGPDGLNDKAMDRALDRAIREDRARRAAQLPAKVTDLDAHFKKFAPAIDAINAGFAATGGKKP